jgi:hypothetical protein
LLKNPLPTPDYIDNLDPQPGFIGGFKDRMCIQIWAGSPLSGLNMDEYLFANTKLTLDGLELVADPNSQMDWLMLVMTQDSQGNFSSQKGGPLESCYPSTIHAGMHLATVRIKSTSGVIYSYSWAFTTW